MKIFTNVINPCNFRGTENVKEVQNNKETIPSVKMDVPRDTYEWKGIEVMRKMGKSRIEGNVFDVPFRLNHEGKIFHPNEITGKINNKDVNLKMKLSITGKQKMSGTIGDKNIELMLGGNKNAMYVVGEYCVDDINLEISKQEYDIYKVTGQDTKFKLRREGMRSDNFRYTGYCNNEKYKEIAPLVIDMIKNMYMAVETKETAQDAAIIMSYNHHS